MRSQAFSATRAGAGRPVPVRRHVPARPRLERLERRSLLNAISLGPEFPVNTFTPGYQAEPAVAVDADGDFVVTWYSYAQDGNGRGIYARLYDAEGTPQTDEFLVNTHTTGSQTSPAVAVDADGDFVIVWQSDPHDASGAGVYAQRFDAEGVKQGPEFPVATMPASEANPTPPSNAAVAMDADGDFVVAWDDGQRVFARRFDAAGLPLGDAFPISEIASWVQAFAAVGMDAGGAFAVAWGGRGHADDPNGIHVRRFDAAGAPLGPTMLVNAYTTDSQQLPSLSMNAAGEFVVAWESDGQDQSSMGVYAQRFDAAGEKQGDEFRVNTFTLDHQHNVSAAIDGEGNFVVTWTSKAPGTSDYGVYAQRYNAAGVPQGGEFVVNTYTPLVQHYPAVASGPDGDFVVAWESFAQDGSGFGVYAQRFASAVKVTDSEFVFLSAPHELRFRFNADVAASLGSDDLVVENLTTGQALPSTDFTVAFEPKTNTATFTYTGPGAGPAGALADGNYRATLLASGISTTGGVTPRQDHEFEFTFLRGDASGDGQVNLVDFNRLAANFGQNPRDFTQGDFNYDGTVNLLDFNILAARFGQVLASAAAANQRSNARINSPDADDTDNHDEVIR